MSSASTSRPQAPLCGIACFDMALEDCHVEACDGNSLSMDNQQVYGSIPPVIGSMLQLTHFLYLPRNELSGTIPPSLCSLTKLEMIDLYDNALTGTLPKSIGSLQAKSMYLAANFLSGTLPSSIGSLSTVSSLLIANVFSGFVPSSMCNLVDTVDECKLTGSEFYCPLPEPCSGWLVETCKLNNSCIPAPETLGAWGSWSDCEDCVQSQHFFVGSNGSNSGELYTSRTRNCSDSCSDSLVLSTEDWIAVGVSIVVVLAAIATLVVVRRKRLATKWEQARPRTLGVVSDKYRRKSLDECLEGVDSILLAPDVTGITSTTPVVAQGGAGRVYKSQLLKPVVAHGQWFAKGSAIALKELYSMLLGNGEECAKEFVFLSQLHHRGIVPFLGLFKQRAGDEVSPPRYFLVTKYCSNGHLGDHIESESVPFRTRRAWVADIGFAVQYLHDRNVIHRDLKPENILLDEQLQCQLTDFGLARSFNRQGALTTSIGTVHYMAPEMLDNSHRPRSIKHRRRASSVSSTRNSANAHADVEPSPPVDQAGTSSSPDSENIPVELNSPRTSGPLRKFAPAIDVYSLGILVATIFNAQPPYDGLPTGTVIAGVIAGKLRPDLPAQLSSEGHHLLQRMWHNDPHQRPKMTEFLEAFDEFLSSTPPSM